MPRAKETKRTVLQIPCDPAYARFLDALGDESRRRGHTTPETRVAIVELACNLLGFQWGLKAPRRVRPLGSNQHGDAVTPPDDSISD